MPNASTGRVLVALAALLAAAPLAAQAPADRWADSARALAERAYVGADTAAMAGARLVLDRALTAFPDDAMLLHYQGYALWREAQLRRGADLGPMMEAARAALERSAARRPLAETHALLSMVYGSLIGADPSRAMELGMKAQEAMQQARRIGEHNPRVLLLAGMSAFYTPEEWGGGVAPAERLLEESARRFETDAPAAPLPAWGRAEVHAWLGQVREKQGRPADAAAEYRRALAIEPDMRWVSRVLLPRVAR